MLQRTIRTAIKAQGVGVHSGKSVTIYLQPAPPNTGIKFRRVDLDPVVEIPASIHYVVDTALSTCIGLNGQSVNTVEHLMSALAAFSIDNLYIDIDDQEIPIMDGSAAQFIFLLQAAGVVAQSAQRQFFVVKKTVSIQDEKSKALATLSPFSGYRIDITIDYDHPAIPAECSNAVFDFSSTEFIRRVARSRTFGFLSDYNTLRKRGMALGSSLDNSVCLDDKTVMNQDGLRFYDELVRHKILDAVGDHYLLGYPLQGCFKGYKTGHAMNNRLLLAVLEDEDAWELRYANELSWSK